jgi:ABC-type bacteriocin/lantibiotic exporter with double-glycine peptidase domain
LDCADSRQKSQDELFNDPGFSADIRIEALEFSYSGTGKKVIAGIDLQVSGGQSLAIVGASGAGKTTLVDLVLGVLTPDEGSHSYFRFFTKRSNQEVARCRFSCHKMYWSLIRPSERM